MRADAIKCGAYANQSEADANDNLLRRLKGSGDNLRFLLLSNLASAVSDRAIPDEIDLVAIGSTGLFIIEIKHWDRSDQKSFVVAVEREPIGLSNSVRRIVFSNDSRARDASRCVNSGAEFLVLSEWNRQLKVGAVCHCESGTRFQRA